MKARKASSARMSRVAWSRWRKEKAAMTTTSAAASSSTMPGLPERSERSTLE